MVNSRPYDIKIDGNMDLFVAALAANNVPALISVTLSAEAAVAATTLAVTALSAPIYEGQRLTFGAQTLRVTADVATSATSIPVTAVETLIASAASISIYALKPIYSVESYGAKPKDKSKEYELFDSPGDGTETVILGRGQTVSCKALDLEESANIGIEVVKTAARSKGTDAILYVEFIDTEGLGEAGFASVQDFTPSERKSKEDVSYTWTFNFQGLPTQF